MSYRAESHSRRRPPFTSPLPRLPIPPAALKCRPFLPQTSLSISTGTQKHGRDTTNTSSYIVVAVTGETKKDPTWGMGTKLAQWSLQCGLQCRTDTSVGNH